MRYSLNRPTIAPTFYWLNFQKITVKILWEGKTIWKNLLHVLTVTFNVKTSKRVFFSSNFEAFPWKFKCEFFNSNFWPHCAHGDVHCKHVRRWVSLKVQIVLSSSVVRNAKLSHATLLRMIAAIIYVGNSPPTWRLSASWPSVGEKRAPNKIHGGPTVS